MGSISGTTFSLPMKNIPVWRLIYPHLIAIIAFIVLTNIYFLPTMQGKVISSHDAVQGLGMSKEIRDHRAATGKDLLWTSRLFSGMPSFQINVQYPSNLLYLVSRTLSMGMQKAPALLLTMLIGFYVLLVSYKMNYWLAIIGSIAFAFSTFFILSIEAGHTGKVRAICYMAPTLAGILMTYKGKWVLGGVLTILGVGMLIFSNHFQIIYYLLFVIGIIVITEFIFAIKEKAIVMFFKSSAVLVIAALIGVGPNISKLWATYDYAKETIRGGTSELTNKKQKGNAGLDWVYATAWSYGQAETFTLLVPLFAGGSGNESIRENSNLGKLGVTAQNLKHVPTYWGKLDFTGGPVYAGAIMCYLFILGLFLINGRMRVWIIAATLLTIMLAWGKNYTAFYELFFYNFPLFNKFRTPSMWLTIACFTIPFMGIMSVHEILKGSINTDRIKKALKYSMYIVGGILGIFIIMGGVLFDFSSPSDAANGFKSDVLAALISDRIYMFRMSSIRSLILIGLVFGTLWFFVTNKIKKEVLLAVLGVLVLFDMWGIDKRYLNKEDFIKRSAYEKQFTPTGIDNAILADTDLSYRVFNVTTSTFNDAKTSYLHKSIGGYHAAKLIRYQDLIENQISKNNIKVLNMLNARYFIVPDPETKEPRVQKNPDALGNAWFVRSIKWTENADAEMAALNGDFKPERHVVIDKRYQEYINNRDVILDSKATINLVEFQADRLVYEYDIPVDNHFAVFSEVYYEGGGNDWRATIDGQDALHIRVNYTLRGMMLPAGKHQIIFTFHPRSYYAGERVSLVMSILMFVVIIGAIYMSIKKGTPVAEKQSEESISPETK